MSTDMEKLRAEAKAQAGDATIEVEGEDSIVVDGEEQTPEEKEMTALQVLLGAKPVRQRRTMKIKKRDGLPQDLKLVLGSLTESEFKSIGEEAEITDADGNKDTDNNLFLRLIVARAIREPNLSSAEVLQAHGAVTADMVVASVFLPGEVARLAENVMSLSGWDDDAVTVAKN